MDNYYIDKCQILVDIYLEQPIHIDATQEMVDELKEEEFLNSDGSLTEQGEITAKLVAFMFNLAEETK